MISRKPDELVDLITKSRTVLSSFAKAKTAKLGKHEYTAFNVLGLHADVIFQQSDNSSISSTASPIALIRKSPSQSHVSNGLPPNDEAFSAKTSKLDS